jgi:AraC-like DNA-binding protein
VPELQHTLALLFAESTRLRCGQRLMANRLFEVLLLQLLRWLLDHPEQAGLPPGLLAGLAHPKLARALVALHEQPGEAWDLDAMARAAGMSRSAFAAAFKREVRESPAAYLLHWRIALAQQRLAAGEPLKAVAAGLGYSPNALSRAFGQVLGQTPRAWLQSTQAR